MDGLCCDLLCGFVGVRLIMCCLCVCVFGAGVCVCLVRVCVCVFGADVCVCCMCLSDAGVCVCGFIQLFSILFSKLLTFLFLI